MASKPIISWDRPMLERFKVAYTAAPGDAHSEFIFDGHTLVKGYAKYLIEFLEPQLPNPNQGSDR